MLLPTGCTLEGDTYRIVDESPAPSLFQGKAIGRACEAPPEGWADVPLDVALNDSQPGPHKALFTKRDGAGRVALSIGQVIGPTPTCDILPRERALEIFMEPEWATLGKVYLRPTEVEATITFFPFMEEDAEASMGRPYIDAFDGVVEFQGYDPATESLCGFLLMRFAFNGGVTMVGHFKAKAACPPGSSPPSPDG